MKKLHFKTYKKKHHDILFALEKEWLVSEENSILVYHCLGEGSPLVF
mgnify:CR=1 FL=1